MPERILLAVFLLIMSLLPPLTTAEQTQARDIPQVAINGAIGPGTSEYIRRQIENAEQNQAPLLVLTLDTPGGLSASLRTINQAILGAEVPVACLVYPQGARAASAGTYLLYACHFSAMAQATTLGAATPVNITAPGQDKPKSADSSPTAMEQKMLNDAVAYIRSLAELRDRNIEWAELAVREAATLTAEEAVKQHVVDLMADTPEELVNKLNGRTAQLSRGPATLNLDAARLVIKKPDWRHDFITTITDPNIAYILMLVGIYGLLLEFYSPGIGVAGISGAISLLLALYAFQLLPLNFSGVALLLLGIGLLIAEAMIPSFGIFGVGGIVSFVLGSIFLIDTQNPHYQISVPLIAAVALVSVLFLVFALSFLWRNRNAKIVSGAEELIGAQGTVEENFSGKGFVIVGGERWAAMSPVPLSKDQTVKVSALDGLTLIVAPCLNEET